MAIAHEAKFDAFSAEKIGLELALELLEGDIQSMQGEAEIRDYELAQLCEDAHLAQ